MRTFKYFGYHFTPVKRLHIASFRILSGHLKSDYQLGLSKYEWSKHPYSYDGFYKAAVDKEFDLFRCEENGLIYIPGDAELFQYV